MAFQFRRRDAVATPPACPDTPAAAHDRAWPRRRRHALEMEVLLELLLGLIYGFIYGLIYGWMYGWMYGLMYGLIWVNNIQ